MWSIILDELYIRPQNKSQPIGEVGNHITHILQQHIPRQENLKSQKCVETKQGTTEHSCFNKIFKENEKKKYLESKRNGNVIYQNLWEVDKGVLSRSSWS